MGNSLISISEALTTELENLDFSDSVPYVYNPLVYAWEAHEQYLLKYGEPTREIILVGMNPGPWGMVQTGVPFGTIKFVRGWLHIETSIQQPMNPHPKRPVLGFACTRDEVSGSRVWSWAHDHYGNAGSFFKRFFIINYCPLAFFDETGKNITPEKLKISDRKKLYGLCDYALKQFVAVMKPHYVIGIGNFARKQIDAALGKTDVKIGTILHPSPANPQANKGWAQKVNTQLKQLGLTLP